MKGRLSSSTLSRRIRQRIAPVATAAALLAMAAGLVACGGEDDDSATLRWFVAIQPGGSIQEVAKRCTEQSDGKYRITLELLPTDADSQREQLVRRLGAEDRTVDIIGMDVIWTAEFANAGWIRPWRGEHAKKVTEGVFDSVIETASFEGELYGAPFNSNTQLLWYRTDKVDSPPETWDDMISTAEDLDMYVQVQAGRYEGYTVWVNSMITSAGTQILSWPEEVDLAEEPTETALATIGKLARSPAAAPNISTSNEDSARLGFEAGNSAFMLNYTFAYASAQANAPDIAENMGAAKLPKVVDDHPSSPPLGGFNLGIGAYSANSDLAFEAATCLASPENQLVLTELDGLPPSNRELYSDDIVQKAFPGFADEIRDSIADAVPRPLTPAYTDVSLAIQRSLHPPQSINPDDPEPKYDELKQNVQDAVLRKGLL